MSSADRVLVCDDDARSVRAPRVVLRDAGFRVVACASAEDALDAAALRMPAAAIVELAVPDADGVALVRKLREWSAIPVVVLSAIHDEHHVGRALNAGLMTTSPSPSRRASWSRGSARWSGEARGAMSRTGSSTSRRATSRSTGTASRSS